MCVRMVSCLRGTVYKGPAGGSRAVSVCPRAPDVFFLNVNIIREKENIIFLVNFQCEGWRLPAFLRFYRTRNRTVRCCCLHYASGLKCRLTESVLKGIKTSVITFYVTAGQHWSIRAHSLNHVQWVTKWYKHTFQLWWFKWFNQCSEAL